MIRPLLIVFVSGAVLAVGCCTAYGFLHDGRGHPAENPGPVETRDFPWTDGPSLKIAVPAEVTYIQGPAVKLVATGPAKALDALEVKDGTIDLSGTCWSFGVGHRRSPFFDRFTAGCDSVDDATPLRITLTAPSTREFEVSGAAKLDIQNYDQPEMKLEVSGAGEAKAAGKAGKLDLDVSGAGKANLSDLTLTDATVEASGAGHASLKPTGKVEAHASGAGGIELLVRPASLDKEVSGAGEVEQPDPGSTR